MRVVRRLATTVAETRKGGGEGGVGEFGGGDVLVHLAWGMLCAGKAVVHGHGVVGLAHSEAVRCALCQSLFNCKGRRPLRKVDWRRGRRPAEVFLGQG